MEDRYCALPGSLILTAPKAAGEEKKKCTRPKEPRSEGANFLQVICAQHEVVRTLGCAVVGFMGGLGSDFGPDVRLIYATLR
jgi:hypothetical protein